LFGCRGGDAYAGDRSGIKFLAKISKKYGLDPIDSNAPRILMPAELKNFCEPLDKLIYIAQEEVDQLYEVAHEELDQPTSSRRPTPESDRWCSSR
jgi:hypothetical protein